MPTKGQIITNPISGDTYEFIETAQDTKGESVTMIATISSKGKLVPDHRHMVQDETFEVLSGQLTIQKEGKTTNLSPGEKMTFLRKIPHNHFNELDQAVVYRHTVTPALDFDYLIENLVGLIGDGKDKNGQIGLVQELVFLRYLDSKTYLADMPIGLQNLLMNTIAPVARLFGYRAIYNKYSDFEK